MHYTGEIYRPPMEARYPLLEVTAGCSHNQCRFCMMYRNTPFQVSPIEDIEADIIEISRTYSFPIKRIFLLNGDPFVLSTERLEEVGQLIHKYLPDIKTITCYTSIYNLKNKSVEDLKRLRKLGYNKIYIGLETGYAPALELINKGCTVEEEFEGLEKLKEAGIEYHAIIMLGIASRGNYQANAEATAKVLNFYPPRSISVMPTSVIEGSELAKLRDEGKYIEATEGEQIKEQIVLLENLKVPDETVYFGVHMYNLISTHGTFKEKDAFIQRFHKALNELDEAFLNSVQKRHGM